MTPENISRSSAPTATSGSVAPVLATPTNSIEGSVGRSPSFMRRITPKPRHEKLLLLMWFLAVLVAMVVPLLDSDFQISAVNAPEIGSFALVGAFSATALFFAIKGRPFSIYVMHWIFCLLFLFYAPLLQFLSGKVPSGSVSSFYNGVFQVNLIVFVWIVTFALVYNSVKFRQPKFPVENKEKPGGDLSFVRSEKGVLAVTLLGLGAAAGVFLVVGVARSLLRGAQVGENFDQTSALVAGNYLRAMTIAACLLLGFATVRNKILKWSCFLLCLLPTFAINSPVAVARFWFAALAIGILALFIRKKRTSSLWMVVGVVSSLLFLMPLLNAGRRASDFKSIAVTAPSFNSVGEILSHGDFDAYAMLANGLPVVSHLGTQGPERIIGNLLFFVPRSMWSGKPYGSGTFVSEYHNFRFTNLSFPLPGEGFLNFGWIGVGLFAAVAALLVRFLDTRYWYFVRSENPQPLNAIYPFLPGLFFFIMRGDFLASFSYTCGLCFAFYTAVKVAHWAEGFSLGSKRRKIVN